MAKQASSASGTSKVTKWIAPSKGGYSAKSSRVVPSSIKRTPPKNPASSTYSSSTKGERG
jgi:hypothetical protein